MKKCVNGKMIEMTAEETAEQQVQAEQVEREYWASVDYDEAVNEKIRERYSASQEFAILRQKDEKPEEYKAYYDYCESCKAFVKQKKEIINGCTES